MNVSREAEADILDAYVWYENHLEELGARFLEEVEKGICRAVIHTFPYLVFYSNNAESITVLAVIRASQDPAYIESRFGA